jgi:predicted MFS family arabinose efflux permease
MVSSVMACIAALYLTTAKNWGHSILGVVLFLSSFAIFMPSRNTMIADNTDPNNMPATYSIMNIAWPVGLIIGPLLGGFLADNYGWNYVFYLTAFISLLSIIPAYFFRRTTKGNKRLAKKNDKIKFFNKKTILFLFVFSLFLIWASSALGVLDLVVPLYLTKTFNLNKTSIGSFLSMGLGLSTLLSQIPSGILANKYGLGKVLTYCILPLPVIMILWLLIQNFIFLLILYMLIWGLWSMTWSITQSYLMDFTPTLKRGLIESFRQTSIRFGLTIGPIVGGYFWQFYSPATAFLATAGCFAISLLFIVLSRNFKREELGDTYEKLEYGRRNRESFLVN